MVIRCPKCSKLFESVKEKIGKKEVCEHCDYVFTLDNTAIYKENQHSQDQQAIETEKIEKNQTTPFKSEQTTKPKKKRPKIWLIALASIAAIVIVLLIIGFVDERLRIMGGQGILPTTTQELVTGTYKIGAGNYKCWEFSCKDGSRLVGYVRVPKHDINIWLIKGQREFEAYKRGETYYYIQDASAKKALVLSIDCVLSEGTYYFIVDNSYSIFTPKYPEVNISLEY